jgi:hypothetical protein
MQEATSAQLDSAASDLLMTVVSHFEGDYWTLNLDGEFEGRFDLPIADAEGNRIPVEQRREHPDFRPNPNSKFGPSPSHVGLSFGFVQFTQESGSLGALLERMRRTDALTFRNIFGDSSDELVEVTTRQGSALLVDDPSSPAGKARRSPRVAPLGGNDLWKGPWVERFIAAGKHLPFQAVQRGQAAAQFLSPMIMQAAIPFDVSSQKGLCVLLDRSVQLGPAGCARLLRAVWGDSQQTAPEQQRFEALYRNVQEKAWSHRMRKILDSSDISFDVRYQLA